MFYTMHQGNMTWDLLQTGQSDAPDIDSGHILNANLCVQTTAGEADQQKCSPPA
jgi:hypothetical protein